MTEQTLELTGRLSCASSGGAEAPPVPTVELDVNAWAEEQFGACVLGDRRRTRRLVKFGAQCAANPDASTPDQTESWADCQAAYRLFDHPKATFAAIARPHWQRTRAVPPGRYLVICDTTTVDFGVHRKVQLSRVGDGHGNGFLLHSALLVRAGTRAVLGLAGQAIRHRQPVPEGETSRQRLQREDRESNLWGEVIVEVGPPPPAARFTYVCDRGADNFEVFARLERGGDDWVIRAAQLDRLIFTPDGQRRALDQHLAAQPALGQDTIEVPAKPDQPARQATLILRAAPIRMPRPRECSVQARRDGPEFIDMYVVEAFEPAPPKGVEPLRWVLLTSHAADTFHAAQQVVQDYECRPIIEDFHKGAKTGCQLESRQYQSAHKLEAITAVLSVVAVRLLQIRTAARETPHVPARTAVPERWVNLLEALGKGKHRNITTVYEFYRALAGLGGHLGRKRDGEPGWITLWRGLEKLLLALRGADAARRKCV